MITISDSLILWFATNWGIAGKFQAFEDRAIRFSSVWLWLNPKRRQEGDFSI